MAETGERPVLPTQVGHVGPDHHRFRGFDVGRDLVGHETYWSVISLAIGGPRLAPDDSRLLDDLATSLVGPDPRIWPWKLCRLMSAYGRFSTGMAGPLIMMSSGSVGPAALAAVARFFEELARELGPDDADDAALGRALDHKLERSPRPPGFGTPFRNQDERNAPILALVRAHGRERGRYFSLVERAAPLVLEKKQLPMNAAALVSGICLDLGFSSEQIDVFGILLLVANTVANSFEGSRTAPAVLKRLPREFVRYVGQPPRPSPRAASGKTP
ncbi:MAG TPA: hypothetical protein VMI54_07115 [Polyangiaceae bacterium]|nr:hypothetical protein [Polyangiaceae bacterium]